METFDYLYRKLAQATVALLFAAVGAYLATLACALLGLTHATSSLNSVTLSLVAVFGGMLLVFLVSSLVRASVLFLTHRQNVAN